MSIAWLSGHFLTWVNNFFCVSNQEVSAFDFGELEEAIVLQGVKIRNDEAKARMLFSLSQLFLLFVTFVSITNFKKQREREREIWGLVFGV